ncbi:Bromodomain containing protein [Reticulomyxa filosa]|uniref:Bromodomain containing protein n=1 Tax=Reticulomyxa filosa TaxID=46433 RepID=X6LLU3_RETFI|nr:Bromodomain containing protein [Reticulomyxa filosa]|eukprot:ETO02868.1 Bromodomain containing protein [Reticulomyxa filosa]
MVNYDIIIPNDKIKYVIDSELELVNVLADFISAPNVPPTHLKFSITICVFFQKDGLTAIATAQEIKKDETETKDFVKTQENSEMIEGATKRHDRDRAKQKTNAKAKSKTRPLGGKREKKASDGKDELGDTEKMDSDVAVATKNANMANHYKPELEHCNCYSRIHKHYCNILKRPMDLSTINEKMKNGKYTDAAMFAKGVRKVWKHYLTFNTSGSPLYCVTDNLSKQFKKKFSRVLKYQTNGAYVRAEINTKTIISTIKNEEFMP